jgi:hypothetical protein
MPKLLRRSVPNQGHGAPDSDSPALRFLLDNGLSLAFLTLYLGTALGQTITGIRSFNDQRLQHALPTLPLHQFLLTGTYLDSIFVNWQAAVLQLAALIVFSSFLYQKGAAHSRKDDSDPEHKEDTGGRHRSWLFRHSLSLAFFAMFLLTFALHSVFATLANNELLALDRQPPVPIHTFIHSANFWASTLACWQAEFFAIFAYVVLSIFLRQQNSPESKPGDSPDHETGGSNE